SMEQVACCSVKKEMCHSYAASCEKRNASSKKDANGVCVIDTAKCMEMGCWKDGKLDSAKCKAMGCMPGEKCSSKSSSKGCCDKK
ncbi:MAG: hypothetical protein ACK53R_03605, partial [Bacteroidota bacterium]